MSKQKDSWLFRFLYKTKIKKTVVTFKGKTIERYQAMYRDLTMPIFVDWWFDLNCIENSSQDYQLETQKLIIDEFLDRKRGDWNRKEKVSYIKYP